MRFVDPTLEDDSRRAAEEDRVLRRPQAPVSTTPLQQSIAASRRGPVGGALVSIASCNRNRAGSLVHCLSESA